MRETRRPTTVAAKSAALDSATAVPAVVAPVWLSIFLCCALMSLAAQVRIPVPGTDVPMTLQSLAVLLTGFALRPGRAVAAVLAYLALGTLGLPVFAAGSQGVLGLTGGYLIGFVAGACLVSVLKGGVNASYLRLLGAGAAGTAVVFILGVGWRMLWPGGGPSWAVATGMVPFAAKAGVQILLAATLVKALRSKGCRGPAGRTL